MQKIIIEKPYEFVPPHRGDRWPSWIQRLRLVDRYLRRNEGVDQYECRHLERLRHSLSAGYGILLTPNHSRTSDPLVMGFLGREAPCHVFAMASWHLFNQDWFTGWAIRKMGGFSVHREGDDRRSLNTAIEILATASRPLVIFPEGSTSHSNDRLHPMLDGVAILARAGAKKRMKNQKQQGSTNGAGKVVVHPIALKYRLQADLFAVVDPVLREIEQQFTWRLQDNLPLLARIEKLADAQLCLKEIEYFGAVQSGGLRRRIDQLIERLLVPVEQEWLGAAQSGKGVAARVKALRMKMVPEMVDGVLSQKERNRRWRQLADLYLAQQISCYLPNYLRERPSVDRLLETVERFDEDLNDYARVMGRRKVIIEVGEAIEVSPQRDRRAPVDPLMEQIRSRLQSMLDKLALESPLWEDRRHGKDLAPRPIASPAPQQPETRTEFARE